MRNIRIKTRTKYVDLGKYKYKHLIDLMLKKYGSLNEAATKIGYNRTGLRDMLEGNTMPRKDFIDAILGALDITYEEAFVEDYQ